ncbi:uncharacterized protein LOC129271934 isoform X2 [Lytechinus pictus]|uniref:uncharacterized protein LOC129271934 isoform X2 n=1 Tax=Lytechinus pictus TaxID=7653 RepID=UPI0030BA033A
MSMSRKKITSEIDKLEDICFQDEVEIMCNFLRWDSFPKRSTENFKQMLEKRARNFFVEDYIPAADDVDASHVPVLPWRLFYVGSPGGSGDEGIEDPLKFELSGGQIEGVKRPQIVIPHPRQQRNILSKVHEGKEGVRLHGREMWEKIFSVYYWRDMRTSVSDFMKSCKDCRLQDLSACTGLGISAGIGLETSESRHKSNKVHVNAGANNDNQGGDNDDYDDDDEDDRDNDEALEGSKSTNELPYHEEVDQVYNYLKLGKYPTNSNVNQKRGIRRKAKQYMLGEDDGDVGNGEPSKKLYHFRAPNANIEAGLESQSVYMRLVVASTEEQQKILQVAHIGPSGQHFGRDKMRESISLLYFWKGLHESIRKFLLSCSKCQMKHVGAKNMSLDRPSVHSEAKRKSLDHPITRSEAKKKLLDLQSTYSEAKKSLDHSTTSKAKKKSNHPIIKLNFKKAKKQPPKEDGLVSAPAMVEQSSPPEITKLPKGLSHLAGLDAEVEALILYLYLKRHEYPPDCTSGFKRVLRKKAMTFCLHENDGDGGDNWFLFYKGDIQRITRDIGQATEAEEDTGAVMDTECAESTRMKRTDGSNSPVDSQGAKEPDETDSDTPLSKQPVVIKNDSPFVDKTGNRLYVYRKLDKEKIIQHVHLKGGNNGKHASSQRISSIIARHFYWRGIKDDVMDISRKCSKCRRNSSAALVIGKYVQEKSTEDVLEEDLSSHQLPQYTQTYLDQAMRMETHLEVEEACGDPEQVGKPCNLNEIFDRRILKRGDRLALSRFPIKPQKVNVEIKPRTAKQEMPPLPSELTGLPKGLSHIRGLDTELEGLIIYLYLKWHEYPPGCTEVFKRMVRKKARIFSVYEYKGLEGQNWCLFYKGEGKGKRSLPIYPDQAVEGKEHTGDMQVEGADSIQGLVETTEPEGTEETEELGEVVQVPETVGRQVTVESDTLLPKVPAVIGNEMPIPHRTHRIYVFRRADKDIILKYMHLNGGTNGKHAPRDRITDMVIPYFYWRGLREDILDVIMNCKQCQMKRKASRGELDDVYCQDYDNQSPEEELPSHQLPWYMHTYLGNAMEIDGWLETEDLPMKGKIVNSNEPSSKEDLQTAHSLTQDRSTTGYFSTLRHKCDSCPRAFRDSDSLRRHKRAHLQKKSFKECPVCGKKTTELLVHMRSHTKEKPLECDICNQRFAYRSGLSLHKKKHFGVKPFRCSDCPMQFFCRSSLKAHFRSSHEGRGEYQCDICEKVFVTQFRLDKHQRTHSKYTFVCEQCGKVLSSAFTLKYHRLIHTGENRILCEICGKGFKKKCDLKKHIEHHLGIKNHQCHLCQQRFCHKGDLQDHLRVHQGASSYECDICQKKFKNKRSLARCKRKHGLQAAPAAVFQCNTCEDVLGTLEDFKQHTAAHHLLEGAQLVQHEVEIQ